jgi:hypothetical protein
MNDDVLFTLLKIDNHESIKPLILSAINEMNTENVDVKERMGLYGTVDEPQLISKSDWYLPPEIKRPYHEFVAPLFPVIAKAIKDKYNYHMHIKVSNYWFQQYKQNDFHSWHIHEKSLLSCVYYVDMSSEAPKTTFNILGKETEIAVSEGHVLVFPSYLLHCSKPNKDTKKKTVISFNIEAVYE